MYKEATRNTFLVSYIFLLKHIDHFFKNNDYASIHCPSEHIFGENIDDATHISFVPHLHCPFVHVSVAPEQSSSVLHPVVMRIIDENFIAF